jgi:hypothetical protein
VAHKGQPTVILAKTIKGYGMGEAGEAQNITHQQKKMGTTSIKAFRDRFKLPVKDEDLEKLPYLTFPEGSPELNYMRERRMALGGYLPSRRPKAEAAAGAAAVGLRRPAQGRRRGPRVLHHHVLRARPQRHAEGQGHRQARGADRGRRVAHLRHGRPVPPDRHLEPGRPELRAAGRRPADVLQGKQDRPDPAGRHQRGRRMADWIAAGTATACTACR